nr:unnamed protein product [Digitaria exilis]
MANFPVDPRPFVPLGFTLVPREVVREPSRLRSFLAFSLEKSNEDLAIVITEPWISKDDFWPFARELRAFLHAHQVQDPEIQQCPMGEAYVRFDSPMQRESFVLGGQGDEEPIPVDGPTHGLPHPAPGWLGPVGMQLGGNADEEASVVGGNVHVAADGHGAAEDNEAIGINDEMPIAADGHRAGANVVLVPEDNGSELEDPMPLNSVSPFSGAAADFEASDHCGNELDIIPVEATAPVSALDALPMRFGPAPPLVPYGVDEDEASDVFVLEEPVALPPQEREGPER